MKGILARGVEDGEGGKNDDDGELPESDSADSAAEYLSSTVG